MNLIPGDEIYLMDDFHRFFGTGLESVHGTVRFISEQSFGDIIDVPMATVDWEDGSVSQVPAFTLGLESEYHFHDDFSADLYGSDDIMDMDHDMHDIHGDIHDMEDIDDFGF